MYVYIYMYSCDAFCMADAKIGCLQFHHRTCVMTVNGILKVAKMLLWNVSQLNIEVYFCRGGHDELK